MTSNATQGARSRATLVLGIILAFGAGMLTGYLIGISGPASEMDIPQTVYQVDVGTSPQLGPDTAPVTVVLFTDFQCPYCRKASSMLDKLRNSFGDDLRIVFKHYPMTQLHPTVFSAHEAAVGAMAQGDFWSYHDKLFEHKGATDRTDLERFAADIGMDTKKLATELDRHVHKAVVDRDVEQGKALGVQGTPTFFVNGRKVVGANYKRIKHIVRFEIKHAKELVNSGVPADSVYAKIMEGAVRPVTSQPAPVAPTKQPAPLPPVKQDPNAIYRVDLLNSTVLGTPDAPVTLVMFMDYQCGFSAKAQQNVEKLSEAHGDQLRIVYKNNPQVRHKQALLAAEASLAAGAQGKFAEMHAKLFANREKLSRKDIEGFAAEFGLNMPQFKQALDEHKFVPIIKQEQMMAVKLGAKSTPTFFINGRKLKGNQPYEALEAAIVSSAAQAKKLQQQGIAAKDIYATIISKGISNVALSAPPGSGLVKPPPIAPNTPH